MEFTISEEVSLEFFEAWAGGRDRLDRIIELDIVEEASEYIEMYMGTEMTATQLNDFLWFEMDDFIEDYEEEDEEEEEDE